MKLTSSRFTLMCWIGLACGPVLAYVQDASPKVAVPQVAALSPFADWITSLAFSPDGKTLAVGTKDSVSLVDVEQKKPRASLSGMKGQVRALAFSPDGQQLVVGSYQTVQLWNPLAAERVHEFKGHRGYVTGAAFAPDGKRFVTSSEDETVRVWSVDQSEPIAVLKGHSYPVNGVAWSPDGRWIATAAGDDTRTTKRGEVKLWDAATGQEVFNLADHAKAVYAVAFSPDSATLASAGLDEKVILTNRESHQPLGYFGDHQRPVNCVVFHPDGKTLISGSGGRFEGGHTVKLWNRETGNELASLEEHEGRISALAITRDGGLLATGSHDKKVMLWSLTALNVSSDTATAVADAAVAEPEKAAEKKVIRVGMIGLDTSHCGAFAGEMNKSDAADDVAGCKVVAAYPKGSPDIKSSVERVPKYTEDFQKMGIEIVDSIPALLEKVDCVLLETNDGRPHFEQLLPVLKAGKPCFIDKPIAGTLADAVAIFEAAKKYNVPIFSSSSLRYMPLAQEVRAGKIGDVVGCDAFSPAHLEPTHPDLFWYGIHGVEALFTVMGTGCETVQRASTPGVDVVMGTWQGGRVGTFRGIRDGGSGYGGRAFGSKGVVDLGGYGGYRPLVVEIVKFFKTHQPPVSEEETLEIYAFMEAADESKRQGGAPVKLSDVLAKARGEAAKKLEALK
ncbi:MAG: Gfo/Idh/MocA family oxidoreductase [Planctomycetaceae bacterium]